MAKYYYENPSKTMSFVFEKKVGKKKLKEKGFKGIIKEKLFWEKTRGAKPHGHGRRVKGKTRTINRRKTRRVVIY